MRYYLNMNPQSNGDHEIHKETCVYYCRYRFSSHFKYIGTYSNEFLALNAARAAFPSFKIDGCHYCSSLIDRS